MVRYDDLFDGEKEKRRVSNVAILMYTIELQDRYFFAVIGEDR